jgi:hypothetical protein
MRWTQERRDGNIAREGELRAFNFEKLHARIKMFMV